ncbi:MAG: hypothetical protein MUE85_06250 [Microscillaceae bacterium]|nr:hypothetical protein [Microscillaceae bacterium]
MIQFLTPIAAEDKLAQLFNQYMQALTQVEIIFNPAYDAMSGFREALQKSDALLYNKVFRVYELIVLQNSLKGFHQSMLDSIALIENYLQNFAGDWIHYASIQRMESIEKYGGDDEDYDEEGEIIFKQDAESLQYYTLYHELTYHIGGNYQATLNPGEIRGEGIGSSAAEDFGMMTEMVRHKSSFSIFKFFEQQNKPITGYQVDENGEMRPMDIADKLENEMNQDIRYGNLADLFEWAIDWGVQIRQAFEKISPWTDNREAFASILQMLYALQAVTPNNAPKVD